MDLQLTRALEEPFSRRVDRKGKQRARSRWTQVHAEKYESTHKELVEIQELLQIMLGDPKFIAGASERREYDPLLTPEQVAKRLNTSIDWVWDHSSRKLPLLPVIRIGNGPGRSGILRYRASKIEEFIVEQERFSVLRRKPSGRRIA